MEYKAEQFENNSFNVKFAIAIIFGFDIPYIYSSNALYNKWQVELNEDEVLVVIKILEEINIITIPFLYKDHHVSDFRHGTYHVFIRTDPKWYTSNAFSSHAYTLDTNADLRKSFEVVTEHTKHDFPEEKTLYGQVTVELPQLDREFLLKCYRKEDDSITYRIIHQRWVRKGKSTLSEN